MMLRIKRCPHCSRVYETGTPREKIGRPIITCSHCLKYSIDGSTNEWQLLGFSGMLSYIFSVLVSIFVGGILSWMILVLLLLLFDIAFDTHINEAIQSGKNNIIYLGIGCAFLIGIYIFIREFRDISSSKVRMQDPEYQAQLKSAGLLK